MILQSLNDFAGTSENVSVNKVLRPATGSAQIPHLLVVVSTSIETNEIEYGGTDKHNCNRHQRIDSKTILGGP